MSGVEQWNDAEELQHIRTADDAARDSRLTDPTRFADMESNLTLVRQESCLRGEYAMELQC